MPTRDPSTALAACQQWLERAVIGLNLCPYARAPHVGGRIRWVLSEAADSDGVIEELLRELEHLRQHEITEVETTLLVVPQLLADFDGYLDLLHAAEALLQALGYAGEFQLASFHPDYRFEGADADAVENCTNRSPLPMLHVLREDSISRIVDAGADVDAIPERNQQRLRELGHAGWRRLFEAD
ncbi:DUF1415 domain-containing protein [Aquimonas voraii]|uniref:DUF1415 domain-containing protein n=1 Tax=Aquimonas voraii TaxID=265719 RepID=A0A1G6VM89_9GAMM|nr:DUF1415 domain-containing protein [Aquimonas voraii]SDD54750.1 hypothetical protein SAMN04488509_103169 [Aquimonas voraii]